MSKQPKPQKNQPKLYTASDLRRLVRDTVMGLEKHHMELTIGAFALALHRKVGMTGEQIADVLVATNEYSREALCFTEVQKQLLAETGLDLSEFTEEYGI